MRIQNARRRLLVGALAGATALALAACSSATPEPAPDAPAEPDAAEDVESAEPVEDPGAFFEGKTITILIPYTPGGGFDSFVRLLVPELEAELPGVKVRAENRPGGGGMIGANEIYQAEPDGLTIGLINYPGAVFAEATGTEGVTFDNTQWTFLTRLGAINPIVYTGKDAGYPTFESIMDAQEEVTFGIGGVGSDAYYATVVLSEVLGFPSKIIAGYPGGAEADAALLVGEVDAGVGSVDATLRRVADTGTHITALLSTESNPAIPDVPLITSFGDESQQEILTALASIYDLERMLVAPPGMDEARAQFLADAIYAAATKGGYAAAMEAAGLTASPMNRSDVTSRADKVTASIEALTPYVTAAH